MRIEVRYSYWSRSLEHGFQAGLLHLSVSAQLFEHWHLYSSRGQCWSCCGIETHLETVPANKFQVAPDLRTPIPKTTSNDCPCSVWFPFKVQVESIHLQQCTLLHDSLCPSVELCSRVRETQVNMSSASGTH